MLSVIILIVFMLNVIFIMCAIMLSVVMLSTTRQIVIMLSAVGLTWNPQLAKAKTLVISREF